MNFHKDKITFLQWPTEVSEVSGSIAEKKKKLKNVTYQCFGTHFQGRYVVVAVIPWQCVSWLSTKDIPLSIKFLFQGMSLCQNILIGCIRYQWLKWWGLHPAYTLTDIFWVTISKAGVKVTFWFQYLCATESLFIHKNAAVGQSSKSLLSQALPASHWATSCRHHSGCCFCNWEETPLLTDFLQHQNLLTPQFFGKNHPCLK